MGEKTLLEHINFIDIGAEPNLDLVRWVNNSTSVFRLDILAARAAASTFYQKMEKNRTRMVYIKQNSLVFIISADESIQYQLLEAVIESIIQDFNTTYGSFCGETMSGCTTMYDSYSSQIPELCKKAESTAVQWVKANCRGCKADFEICIKKSFIQNAKNFPVSIVFFHRGHGIVLYLDANTKVRGAELVDITG